MAAPMRLGSTIFWCHGKGEFAIDDVICHPISDAVVEMVVAICACSWHSNLV